MNVSDSRNRIRFLLDMESILLMNCMHSIKYIPLDCYFIKPSVLNRVYLMIFDIVNVSVM